MNGENRVTIRESITAERAQEIIDAGGSVHRDDRYQFEYRYFVDRPACTCDPMWIGRHVDPCPLTR
jgi:hypothetical protein